MGSNFKEKHGPDTTINPEMEKAIRDAAVDGALPCAVAHAISRKTSFSPADLGKTADLCGVPLKKCQMGLFGYKPNKKIVKPAENVAPELEKALNEGAVDGRISCLACWDIAKELDVSKMAVSCACEALGLKIKPCQLGAF